MSQLYLFGLKPKKHPQFIVIPIPWEGTVSYHSGTSLGPQTILEASQQIDLWDVEFGSLESLSMQFLPPAPQIRSWNQKALQSKKTAQKNHIQVINSLSQKINQWTLEKYTAYSKQNNIIVLLGGEHSVALSGFQGTFEKTKGNYSILHIDAHFDLRKAYQGYIYSHASVFYNLLHSDFLPKTLVQVGIRDFCKKEQTLAEKFQNTNQVFVFYDRHLKKCLHKGEAWEELCHKIIAPLTENVHISLDIDGLSPWLCPGTGTPVPGGLDFDQVITLLEVVASHKTIVGMDLVEVGASAHDQQWNGNVGMRILYKMMGFAAVSQKWLKPQNFP